MMIFQDFLKKPRTAVTEKLIGVVELKENKGGIFIFYNFPHERFTNLQIQCNFSSLKAVVDLSCYIYCLLFFGDKYRICKLFSQKTRFVISVCQEDLKDILEGDDF